MPARLRDIKRVLESLGISLEEPSSGSHFQAIKDGQMYPIPAHNGVKTEISDEYIRGLCRKFGLNYKTFRESL